MGFTFKENCPDIRNSKIADLVKEIKKYNSNIDVYDPMANKDDVRNEYGIKLINKPIKGKYSAIIIAVAHNDFKNWTLRQISGLGKKNHVIYDLKYLLNINETDLRL